MQNEEAQSSSPITNGHTVSDAEQGTKVIDVASLSPLNFTVVKRNGMLVPFREARIFSAVEAAFRDVLKVNPSEPLSPQMFADVQQVSKSVVAEAIAQAQQGACLTVEGIQDIVEVKLAEAGFHEVARGYILYREDRKAVRQDSPRTLLKIYRRDGKKQVRFNPMKIASAIEKAFRASNKIEGPTPNDIIRSVNLVAGKVVDEVVRLARSGQIVDIELIQDIVEQTLMSEELYQVAKDYILYRAERAKARIEADARAAVVAERIEGEPVDHGRQFRTTLPDGGEGVITEANLRKRVQHACRGLAELVNGEELVESAILNFYDGILVSEIDQALIMATKALIERDPAYSTVAARLLLDVIYRETLGMETTEEQVPAAHAAYFRQYLERAIELDRIDARLLKEFDLDRLAGAIVLERDDDFTYLGLQTLYDRYLIHSENVRLETPQIFWMRVAMGLSLGEGEQKNERAIEFYNVLSQFFFMSSTPTLFNAGTQHPQLSSCYLSTVQDDLGSIFKLISDDAQLSKWAGGLGNDWTNIRATGARIKGTNGLSQGVIPFLKVANDTAVAVNQGGKRKGAMCAYLETWHLDIEDFLELRKNTGDDRRRTHDMNTANWIPDLFMKRVSNNEKWTLFSPSDVPDLHDLYGQAFEKRYVEYEEMAKRGELKLYRRIDAVQLWRKMLGMLFETGHPWMTFKDPSNLRSPQDHVGVVHSSNLCTEILLNTSAEETAVCNLGSVNLAVHTDENGLMEERVASTVRTAIRMLDNVIDINFYPTMEAKNSNLRHRPVGLGMMGFQDGLYIQDISYASHEAVEFADRSMEMISYYAILASSELAAERGTYSTYQGSKWDRGLLPIDTIALLEKERGGYFDVDRAKHMDWDGCSTVCSETWHA